MPKTNKFKHSWYPASDSSPNAMARRCMFTIPAMRVRVMARRGPVNPNNARHSFAFGTFSPGIIPLSLRDLTIQPVPNRLARAVATAAPPQPMLNGLCTRGEKDPARCVRC